MVLFAFSASIARPETRSTAIKAAIFLPLVHISLGIGLPSPNIHHPPKASCKMKFSLVAVSAILSSLVFASPAALTSPALAIRAATKPDNGDLVGQDFELIANQTTLLNQTLTQFHKSGRSVIIAYRIRKQALAAKATLNKIIVDTNNSRRFSYNSTYSAVGMSSTTSVLT